MIGTLYVDKTDNTFADALLIFGLATVVQELQERLCASGSSKVTLRDRGPYYELSIVPGIDPQDLTRVGKVAPSAPAIRTPKNTASLPEDLPPQLVVDYEAWRDRRTAYFAARDALSEEARQAMRQGSQHPELDHLSSLAPHKDWDVFRAINPAALAGYNRLVVQWWQVQGALPEVFGILFDAFARTPNDLEAAKQAWRKLDKVHGWRIGPTTTSLQIYNPSQGKGQNRPKADRLAMENISNSFWLVEWLKAVGFYHAALTKQLRGVKDRKTYVLRPVEIGLDDSINVMDSFREAMVQAQSSVQSDVLAALRYTKALLEHTRRPEAADFASLLFHRQEPTKLIAGFYSAFYKDLGNSLATMNLAYIGLPGWIRVQSEADVADALAVLEEHEQIVRQFDESHSDDVALLLSYRDFVSSTDLWPFFDFTTAYGGYIMSQREQPRGYARQFSEDNLRRLIVTAEPKLAPILENEGFRNIASAIRQSTVVAQYRKHQGDRRYDVRYGLNLELARTAAYPKDFVVALSDFLTKYNAENAQVLENRPGPYRPSIRTTDIADIVALVDTYGSELICHLMLAFGYARSPRPDDSEGDAD